MNRSAAVWILALAAAAGLAIWLLTGSEDAPTPEAPADAGGEEPAREDPLATTPGDAPALEGTAQESPAEAQAPKPAPTPEGVLFRGKVLEAPNVPAAAATLEVRSGSGVVAKATTAEDGTYSFRLVVTDEMTKDWGAVRARSADGTVGWCALSFLRRVGRAGPPTKVEGEVQVGVIILGPAHAFDVQVTSTCPNAMPARLWLVNAEWSVGPPWVELETDASGRATISDVRKGTWRLIAASEGCGRAWTLVKLPRTSEDPVEIELPDAHTLDVVVKDATDQTPIAGAVIKVNEELRLPEYFTRSVLIPTKGELVTDSQGRVRIEGLGGTEKLFLRAVADGYPGGSEHTRGRGRGPGEARAEPGADEITILLHRPMTVRWPLEDKGHGIPPDGTEVVLKPWTNTGRLTVPPKGMIENGELVVPGWAQDGASGYAYVEDKLVARLSARPKSESGFPTAFYPLRRIEVTARLADGSPAKGWFLVVRDGGNNAVAPEVETDAEGRAVMEGLYGGPISLVNVSITDQPDWRGFTKALGSVNLQNEDGRFEVEIPAERTIHVRATVRGQAVPEGFSGVPQLNYRTQAPAEESGEPGLFILRYRPASADASIKVSVFAAGFLAEPEQVDLSGSGDPVEVTVDLRPAGALDVRVKEPEDKRYKVALQRWDETKRVFAPSRSGVGMGVGMGVGSSGRADPNGIVAFKMLEPGRYRAVDTYSGLQSAEVDVAAGGEPAVVDLDASAAGWVKGRVQVPEGETFGGLSVGEVGAKPAPGIIHRPGSTALSGRPVNAKDGTFWFRVPGNRPITLRVYGRTLRPHPTKGRVTVTKAQEGVVLTAIKGAKATLRFGTPARVMMNPGQPRPIAVRLYQSAVEGAGTPLSGILDGSHTKVEFGGYDPGTYTVWVDAPGHVPVVLKDVVLGEGDVDLGEVTLEKGAAFKLQVKVKDGQSPPRFSIWLQKLDEPKYTRHTDAAGESITVHGLGAGRFRVSAMAYSGAVKGINEEIEFDGSTEVVRTIDAR